ncbi:uncharacterized protein LOC135395509 [Ornithodoros turicata]|uniref:uncharacterized protein LOC135395509 n=1 Tax=Ornithodoros turicata TaxID=34597 RepID=UPI003139F66D
MSKQREQASRNKVEPDLSETSQTSSTSSTTSTSTTSTSTTSTSTTSTSTASTSTTSTSSSTTSAKPPPPTSAPSKPGDFLLCSVTSGMADHLPKDGLCNVIFFSLITTNTSVMFSSMRVIALNRIRRYVAASRRTQCGLDFPFNTIVEHRNNIGSSSMLQAIREIGAPLSGVLTAKVGPNWDERSEATSVLLRVLQRKLQSTDGPAIGVTAEGASGKRKDVLGVLSRLLKAVNPMYVVFRSSILVSDKGCQVRAPSPLHGASPSFWCREKRVRVTDGVYSLAWDGFTVKVADDLVTTKEKYARTLLHFPIRYLDKASSSFAEDADPLA